jgi:hypothetical protein
MTIKIERTKTATLVELYNAISERPVKKFKDRPTAELRLRKALEDQDLVLSATTGGAEPVASVVEMADEVGGGAIYIVRASEAPAPATDATRVITLLVPNAKRMRYRGERSDAALRYDQYKDGMTVAEYIAAVEKLYTTNKRFKAKKELATRRARADLIHDEAKGFIRISA